MSITTVATVVSNAKTLLASNLTSWSQLLYENDLEKNAAGKKTNRYGFIAKDATSNKLIIGRISFDHIFQMILMTTFRNLDTDANQSTAVNTLMGVSHDMIKVFKNNRLGQLIVEPVSIQAPEFFDDDALNAVAIRTNLVVKYTNSAS